MEENIIMNEEVMEVAEEVVATGSGKGLKILLTTLALGGIVYGAVKVVQKIKAKKEAGAATVPVYDDEGESDEENK